MKIAYYCPLKPPDHPVPSGDRRVARLLRRALQWAGHKVELVSRFRSFEGDGDAAKQAALAKKGAAAARKLIDALMAQTPGQRPDVWLTYHLYHKAPDHLGPAVCRALGIPYVVVEPSFAPKQEDGPWAAGHEAVRAALRQADHVLTLNPDDEECVRPVLRPAAGLTYLPPFLEQAEYLRARERRDEHRAAWAVQAGAETGRTWLLAVAMMRAGDKLASYELLADALRRAGPGNAALLIAGGGPAEKEVRAAFKGAPVPVHWLGQLDAADLPGLYAAADLFVWPAIREAFGMSILEAQAAGLPVIAGGTPGVTEVVADGSTGLLPPPGDADAFAAAIRTLAAPDARAPMAAAAVEKVAHRHDIGCAAHKLVQTLRAVTGTGQPRAAQ